MDIMEPSTIIGFFKSKNLRLCEDMGMRPWLQTGRVAAAGYVADPRMKIFGGVKNENLGDERHAIYFILFW